jgi:ectoine hydroxylase-related dioxygenase (phytanoyl-CoA dioxygenase family)
LKREAPRLDIRKETTMQIGEWKAVAGMTETYRKAREMGLEQNIAELEAFGFTVIEPEKTGAPAGFAEELLDTVKRIAREEDEKAVDLNRHDNKPAFGRQLFHLINKDPLFVDAVMNPAARTIGKYLMGASYRLYSMVAFLKDGEARPTMMHCDSTGVPPPLPFYGNVCNVSWVLTDYTPENGTLCMVPGSHRLCRHPTPGELPKFMGGSADDDICAPVMAKPGSLAIFHGNTWHGTYPKTSDALRVHVAMAFSRNYVNPAEDFDDVADSTIAHGGPEFARLLGRTKWQGYRGEGPKLERMAQVYSAHSTPYG